MGYGCSAFFFYKISVICQNNWKQAVKCFCPKTLSNKFIISITDADVFAFRKKSQHETAFYKVYGKKAFSSHTTNHAIHLYNVFSLHISSST